MSAPLPPPLPPPPPLPQSSSGGPPAVPPPAVPSGPTPAPARSSSVGSTTNLPQEAYAAALAQLPGVGPARLVALLRDNPPESVWQRVLAGVVRRPDQERGKTATGRRVAWADAARRRDVAAHWRAHLAGGIKVAYLGGTGFPPALAADPEPPGVIFWLGDLGILDRPRVAVIGTRNCTSYGRSVAFELGRDLADCGVCVVSGLALGIDGAAHQGALSAPRGVGPLGVAPSGVDCPYPIRHAALWARVAAAGAVLSEAAPGQPAQSWRFPARNRLIAGLAQAVVVVESHTAGGSMLTVAAAADRGIDILAVPGPVTSASSVGTNQLLHEGVAPARHAGDVLAALGDLRPWLSRETARRRPERSPLPPPPGGAPERAPFPPGGAPDQARQGAIWGPAQAPAPTGGARTLDPATRRVLHAVDRTPTSTSTVADRTGVPIGTLSAVLLQLEALSLVRGHGAWWERCDEE